MDELDLSWNSIEDDAAAKLKEAIPNIRKLNLHKCHLTSKAIIMISDAIAWLQQPMDLIDLRDNSIEDDRNMINHPVNLNEPIKTINHAPFATLVKAMRNIKTLGLEKVELKHLILNLVFDWIESRSQLNDQTIENMISSTKNDDACTIWDEMTSTQIVYLGNDNMYKSYMVSNKFIIETLFECFQKALTSWNGRYQNYSVEDLIKVITCLAKNNTVIMRMFLRCIENKKFQLVALKALWEFALHGDNAKEIKTFENGKVMESLENFSKSDLKYLREEANRMIAVVKATEQEPQSSKDGHIMISYQWDSQDIMLKLRNKLKQRNLEVWMDVDKMEGSTLDRMAEAVHGASVVLMGVSQKYRDSHNCRLEGKYTDKLKKPIIPIKLQDNYRGDGWLGLLVGDKLYYDLSDDEKFDKNFPELLKVLLDKKY